MDLISRPKTSPCFAPTATSAALVRHSSAWATWRSESDGGTGRAFLEEAVAQLEQGGQLAWHAVALLRLERPVPARLLGEVGPAALAGYWRAALGRDMLPTVELQS
jgi:hypothetical protein